MNGSINNGLTSDNHNNNNNDNNTNNARFHGRSRRQKTLIGGLELKKLLRSCGLNLSPAEISHLRQKCGDPAGQVLTSDGRTLAKPRHSYYFRWCFVCSLQPSTWNYRCSSVVLRSQRTKFVSLIGTTSWCLEPCTTKRLRPRRLETQTPRLLGKRDLFRNDLPDLGLRQSASPRTR